MKTREVIRTLAAVLLVLVAQCAMSQQKVSRSLISGGGRTMASTAYILSGSVGQPVVGVTSGKTDAVWHGFWRTFGTGIPTWVGADDADVPGRFELQQNFPNPFNPETGIRYQVSGISNGATFVSLKVFDLLGREVATLINEQKPPGTYEVRFNGAGLASGVYVYRLQAGSFVETKKMVLMK